MKYTVDKKEQYVVFTPQEEKLDSSLSPKLKSELLTVHAEGYENLILDMSHVKYADSSGLSALLVGNREFNREGGIFVIVAPQEHVLKLIKISMLDKVFTIVDTLEEAAEAVFMHTIKTAGAEEEED
ncbi:STAS domain-containing protein [Belliella kenyensis]|uniref:Anti-sigma factor antagonist n=2 Tax=Belliella TaxID=232244 RepID=A0ABS9UWE6_9BACT|nr:MULTISPECIES: STAS domain-containing protein [Belliella]MCH7400285.1 STAS domain-containing protein [Belliella kenyensis]MCH7408485.1 STAS domain-containing protein [Belliella filtrata]MDN3604697.1 STAS domain-containing protein [Belliella kenyensis]MDN3605265.1 STAS domain-containing protein [Belliella kenyensis]